MATPTRTDSAAVEPRDGDPRLFPVLTPALIARASRFGSTRPCDPGDMLLAIGAERVSIFVVVRGRVDIVRVECEEEQLIARLAPGQFSGEVGTLAGQPALVNIRAAEPSEVIEIGRDQLLRIVQTDSDLTDVLIRGFLLPRFEMVAHHFGDVFLVGSHHSPDMLRIREFLSRNDHPYSIMDIDNDRDAQAVLDHFGITEDVTPVLICRETEVLRNPTNR